MLRWAQVTEELRQALWELEEEKEKRRHVEEEMNLKAHEQDNLKNKLSALMEENAVMLMGKEATETHLLVPATSQSEEGDKPVGELKDERENEVAVLAHQKQLELLKLSLQEMSKSANQDAKLTVDKHLQILQVYLFL